MIAGYSNPRQHLARVRPAPLPPGLLVNRRNPLLAGCQAWWLCVPHLLGGLKWYDLIATNHATLTSMANSSNGFTNVPNPGGYGSVLFDGIAGYVNCGNVLNIGTSDLSVVVWFKTATANYKPAVAGIVGKTEQAAVAGRYAILFDNSTGSVYGLAQGASGAMETAGISGLNDAKWHMATLTIVRASGTITLYADRGSTSVSATGIGAGNASNSLNLVFGCYLNASGNPANFFAGSIATVIRYSRALSKSDIANIFDLSSAGYPGLLRRLQPWEYGFKPATATSGLLMRRRRQAVGLI